jgi:hypothetical protein
MVCYYAVKITLAKLGADSLTNPFRAYWLRLH